MKIYLLKARAHKHLGSTFPSCIALLDCLQHFIQIEVLNVKDYPQLHLLCWARHSDHITRSDAFSLYEGNWRFIDENALDVGERQLITALSSEFGKGVINA